MGDAKIAVIIPAYNEAERLPPLINQLVEYSFCVHTPKVEVVIVDDGSHPSHAERMKEAIDKAAHRLAVAGSPHRFAYFVSSKNGGKGNAIRTGWSNIAQNVNWLGFLDADGAVSAKEFWRLTRMLDSVEADVLAGSRIPLAGRSIKRSLFRRFLGRLFRRVAESLFKIGFYDTQCGIKFFKAELVRPLLGKLSESRWLLDLELLAELKKSGARFFEEPIDWQDPGGSKLRFWRDSVQVLLGLLRLRQRIGRSWQRG